MGRTDPARSPPPTHPVCFAFKRYKSIPSLLNKSPTHGPYTQSQYALGSLQFVGQRTVVALYYTSMITRVDL